MKSADRALLVGLPGRLVKRSEVRGLEGGGYRLVIDPIYNYVFLTDV